jgi:hypothetical protein
MTVPPKDQKKFTLPTNQMSHCHETKILSWGLKLPETKNDCPGEVQQQFIPLTESIKSQWLAISMEAEQSHC